MSAANGAEQRPTTAAISCPSYTRLVHVPRRPAVQTLVPPFVAHLAVTVGFDVLRRNFARANPSDDDVIRWGWWFAGLSALAGEA